MSIVGGRLAACLLNRSDSVNQKIIWYSFRTVVTAVRDICKLLCEGLVTVILTRRRRTISSAKIWSVDDNDKYDDDNLCCCCCCYCWWNRKHIALILNREIQSIYIYIFIFITMQDLLQAKLYVILTVHSIAIGSYLFITPTYAQFYNIITSPLYVFRHSKCHPQGVTVLKA
jgi:hypothetical protein